MIKRDIVIVLNLLLLLTGVVYAQTGTTQGAGDQTQQMLQQIQKLQAKQQIVVEQQQQQLQQLKQQAPSTHSNRQFHNKFQYPFQEAEVKSSLQEEKIGDKAFSGAVRGVLPMTPGQIHRLKQIYTASRFAAAVSAGTPPKPIATSMYINLSPGSSPPAVRLSQGFVSSLVFLDVTGAPWPVAAYDLGDPRAFDIAWDKKDNVLMIQAKTLYTYGNLAIRLRGLNTPIMLTLIPGQKIVDYRVDFTVPGYGPDAKALPIDTGLPAQATPILLKVLDGIPPRGSKALMVAEGIGQAWEVHGKMYLRTTYSLLSPGWLATMASADGTTAYELQKTPMLLVSKNGRIVHVKIGGL